MCVINMNDEYPLTCGCACYVERDCSLCMYVQVLVTIHMTLGNYLNTHALLVSQTGLLNSYHMGL